MMQIPGMLRAMAVSPRVYLANCQKNAQEIAALLQKADDQGVSLCVFPELCLTGSTCGDLFYQDALLAGAKKALLSLLALDVKTTFIVGLPLEMGGQLYNCAAVCRQGNIALIPKSLTADRWFTPGKNAPDWINLGGYEAPVLRGEEAVLDCGEFTFGVAIGEELSSPFSPAANQCAGGALIIANPAAEQEISGTAALREERLSFLSRQLACTIVYAGAGFGESTTDMVYAGSSAIYEAGNQLAAGNRFACESTSVCADTDCARLAFKRRKTRLYAACAESAVPCALAAPAAPHADGMLLRPVAKTPFIPEGDVLASACRDILAIQTQALLTRMKHIGADKLVIGVSGGLDSTLALLVAAHTFDQAGWPRKNICAITMPGLGTGERTKNNADSLMTLLECTALEIPIAPAVAQHFADIGQDPEKHDICYENSQARERTQILMDYANKVGAIVLGTGDLSELALGFCTYNGDQMSMYNVNGGVPKTLMRTLVMRISKEMGDDVFRVASDVVSTPISPELLPGEGELTQKTEEKLGSYELHDFFLWHTMDSGASPAKLFALAQHAFADQFAPAAILKALRTFTWRFFTQQFKRSAMPDGAAIGPVSLSPRGGFIMPSDAQRQLWMAEIEALEKAIG